jgi:hypothetical protein
MIAPGLEPNTLREVLELVKFHMIDWITDQSGDNTTALTIDEKESIVRWKSIEDPDRVDIFANHLIDQLLQLYYNLMVGLQLNEDTFPSTGLPLGMPINQYAGNLQAAVDDFYTGLSGDQGTTEYSNIAITAQSVIDDFNTVYNEMTAATGRFQNQRAADLVSFRNTLSTRLLSSENMRDTIVKAKLFERTFLLLVDPDEFEIATSSNSDPNEPYTSQDVFDRYLKENIIEKFQKPDGTWSYKLVPRPMSEGKMSFNKIIFSIATSPTLGDHQVDLS